MHGFEGSFEGEGYYWGKADFRSKWPVDIAQQDSSHAGNSSWNPRPTFKPRLVTHSTLPTLRGPAWSTQKFKEKPGNACSSAHGDLHGREQQGHLGAAPVGHSCCRELKISTSNSSPTWVSTAGRAGDSSPLYKQWATAQIAETQTHSEFNLFLLHLH